MVSNDNRIHKTVSVGSKLTIAKEDESHPYTDINNVKSESPESPNAEFYSKIYSQPYNMVGVDPIEDFKLLEQGLKSSGWLDDTNPILKFDTIEYEDDIIIIRLNTNTKNDPSDWMFFFNIPSGRITSLENDNCIPIFLRQIAEKRWGKVYEKFGNLAINETLGEKIRKNPKANLEYKLFTSVADTLWLFDEGLKFITNEITKQGYKPDNKKIVSLIKLNYLIKLTYINELVGEIKDWIPYVYTGLDVKDLIQILSKKNNPGYDITGEFSTSLETAKKMLSIHPSLRCELLG